VLLAEVAGMTTGVSLEDKTVVGGFKVGQRQSSSAPEIAAGISLEATVEADGWAAVTRAGVSIEDRAEVGGRDEKVLERLALLLLMMLVVEASLMDSPKPWGSANEEDP
jgi:hypothetical protein